VTAFCVIFMLIEKHIGGSIPWLSWWHLLDLVSRNRQFPDQVDHPSLEETSKLEWKEGQIWFEELETTCFSRYQGKFFLIYRYLDGRSWFWRGPLVEPLGTRQARRARNRKDHLHMESQLGQQSWHRNVYNSSHLAQHRFQQLKFK